jgi:exopolysaccharide biosynthesis polyprenyl glycosylphosphotransferase
MTSQQNSVVLENGAEGVSTFHAAAAPTRTEYGHSRPDWVAGIGILLLDVFLWVAIYGLAAWVRGDEFYSTPIQLVVVEAIQLIVIIQSLFIIGRYDRQVETRTLAYTAEHILALIGAALVSSVLMYAAATFDEWMKPSRSVLLVSFIVFTPISLLYRRWVSVHSARTSAAKAFLVIGGGEAASQFYRAYKMSPNRQRLEFVDLNLDKIGNPIAGPGSPLMEGNFNQKLENLSEHYSGVILAEPAGKLSPALLERLVRTQFQRTRVYTLESFYETHWRYVPLDAIDPVWPLQTGFQLARMSPYHYFKRLCDIGLSAALLVISSPLILLIAIAIWLRNGRPVIFKQQRVGRDDERFTVYKFRTMRGASGAELLVNGSQLSGKAGEKDAELSASPRPVRPTADAGDSSSGESGEAGEEGEEDLYTRENDPRLTGLGRILRKLRLDELPQLWNVLRGEMSLIGPRAEWTKCVERYQTKIPFYHFRHLVKPGITGWAQVNYPYGESEADALEKLKYDLYYIRHYSLKLDAMIILKTVHTMLFSRGR